MKDKKSEDKRFPRSLIVLGVLVLVIVITVKTLELGQIGANWAIDRWEERILTAHTIVEKQDGGYRVIEKFWGMTIQQTFFSLKEDGVNVHYEIEEPSVLHLMNPPRSRIPLDTHAKMDITDPERKIARALEQKAR